MKTMKIFKTTARLSVVLLAFSTLLTSCYKEESLNSESIVKTDNVDYTPFDYWLQRNYVAPYNINFKYRYEDNESDMNYYTIPARYDAAIILAHLVKYMCLEAYDEAGGIEFTRSNFPKLIFTIGEWEYENNGTYILGTAEGGRKILLSGANYVEQYMKNADDMNKYYLKTIHHEFTHILNQNINYTADFQLITGSGYVAGKWSTESYNTGYLQRGFISAYAQHSHSEDFAEMLSIYVCTGEQRWNNWMTQAGAEGSRAIAAKLDIVKSYMANAFGINLDKLRAAIERRQSDVVNGRIDLTNINN